jgi:glucokinase
MKPYAFGIDIGGTTVKCGFFNSDGTFVEKWEIPTRKEDDGAMILPDIAEAIKAKLAEHGVSMDDVEGIGVGVPGPVLDDGVVNGCVNLGWGVFNVAEKLSGLLGGVPVQVGNDANVAALGEQWHGGGKGFKNVVMVTLGTGVGGGIIIGGRILAGSHGAGGEIGHIQMRKNETAVCGCGKKGCLEQYASATGIVRMSKILLEKDKKESSLRSLAEITSKDIFDAAKTGDALSLKLVDTLGEMLGTALAHITAVVDPDVIVIGGGVSKAGQILLDAIEKHYRPTAFHACRNTQFKLAVLGNDAGMYGAVRMVLNG